MATPVFEDPQRTFLDGNFLPAAHLNDMQNSLAYLKQQTDALGSPVDLGSAVFATNWHAGFANVHEDYASIVADGYTALGAGNTYLAIKKFNERSYYLVWRVALSTAIARGTVICRLPVQARPAADSFIVAPDIVSLGFASFIRIMHVDAATGDVRVDIEFRARAQETYAGFAGMVIPAPWGIVPNFIDPRPVVDVSGAPGTATLTWTAPADTGGIPLTGYQVTIYESNLQDIALREDAGLVLMHTVSGLTSGTRYYGTVQAQNAVGAGNRGGATIFTAP